MKKYLLPAVVCLAIGALVFIIVKMGETTTPKEEPGTAKQAPEQTQPPVKESGGLVPYQGATSLRQNEPLRELERCLARGDLGKARWYRQRVCEDLDAILASETLTNNLLADIRANAADVTDLDRRDVVLGMLRVIKDPEATKLIAEEFYRSQSDEERMMLLEAMAHDYHDPKQAAAWVVERALNAATQEDRRQAFTVLERYSNDDDLVVDTALQIYKLSTRPEQRDFVLDAVCSRGAASDRAREWCRERIRKPDAEGKELMMAATYVEFWGDESDAREIEGLAEQYPDMSEFLRERAKMLRDALKRKAGEEPEPPAELPRPPGEEPPPAAPGDEGGKEPGTGE